MPRNKKNVMVSHLPKRYQEQIARKLKEAP